MSEVRPSVLAGSWYPAAPAALAAQVDGFLAAAEPALRPAGRPRLGVAPHAGYLHSGAVAGRLLGLLRDRLPRRVIVLAPNHHARLDRPALSGAAAFATPLGEVPLDRAAVAGLAADAAFVVDDRAHAREHAVEILLPFWQRLAAPAPPPLLVPLLVPQLGTARRRAAAAALAGLLDEGTFLLVSSDFTHYGRAYGFVPFVEDVPAALERLDAGAILRILAADADGLLDYGRETGITMCGLEAAALALSCPLSVDHEAALIDYRRSGDRDGDYDLSVSYAAVLLCDGPSRGSVPDA